MNRTVPLCASKDIFHLLRVLLQLRSLHSQRRWTRMPQASHDKVVNMGVGRTSFAICKEILYAYIIVYPLNKHEGFYVTVDAWGVEAFGVCADSLVACHRMKARH